MSFGGWINAVIPILIVPYYSVIGGWVIKYLLEYIRGDGAKLAEDGYFSAFISDGASTELCFVLFCMFTLVIILQESVTEWNVFQTYDAGSCRTVRDHCRLFCDKTWSACRREIFSCTKSGEFFVDDRCYSHGADVLFTLHRHGNLNYLRFLYEKETSIEGSTKNVEIFDTAIAIMAGLMIIPAVFAFSGGDPDTLQAGPALMFITIPKVFANMGLGTFVGILFFLLVLLPL